eukprot:8718405-Alexandrium_andersonii.AAC.1
MPAIVHQRLRPAKSRCQRPSWHDHEVIRCILDGLELGLLGTHVSVPSTWQQVAPARQSFHGHLMGRG